MTNMFPSMIRWLRENNKWTQAEAADKMGVKRTTYASWESGIKDPGPVGIALCAQLFGVTTDDLIFGIEGRKVR